MASFKALILKAAVITQIAAASDSLLVGSGISTDAGNLTISAAGTDVVVASGKNLSTPGGAGNIDFSASSGFFKTPSGAITIGPGAVGVSGAASFTAAATGVAITNNMTVGGTAIHTGLISANGGIDRSTPGTLAIGTNGTNSTAITLGSGGAGGVVVTIAGDLAVTGNETVTGTQNYTGNATFTGNVTFGTAATETVTYVGRIAGGSLPFIKAVNATIAVDPSTVANAAGGNLTVSSGAGAGAAAGTGGAGGIHTITAGAGGVGTAGQTAGAGGSVSILGGTGGAAGGGTQGAGGAVSLDGGTGLVNGAVSIGTVNAPSIAIGRSGITTTVTGGLTQGTGAFSLIGNGASGLSTTSGSLNITAAASSTWATGAGTLILSGFSGINLQNNGATQLFVGSNSLVIQSGVTLSVLGTGMINLPSLFNINSVAVSANVTSANLGTLTAGPASDASSLHTHAGIGSPASITVSGLTTTATGSGFAGYMSSANTLTLTDSLALASSRFFGINTGTVGSMVTSGLVAAANFTTIGGSPAVGAPVFLAASTDEASAAGKLTATAPSTAGVYVAQVGLCMDPANYVGAKTAKILVQVMPIVLL